MSLTNKDIKSLYDTYENDIIYEKALQALREEIEAAHRIGDQKWFDDASREYEALKMEQI